MIVAPKRHLSIRLDDLIYRHVKSKPNATRYIEGLIKQDFQMEQKEPLYEAIIQRFLKDGEAQAILVRRLNEAAKKPVVVEEAGVKYIKDDWGA